MGIDIIQKKNAKQVACGYVADLYFAGFDSGTNDNIQLWVLR